MAGKLARNASDALGLFVLPALAAALPWRVAFTLMKRLSRVEWLYRDAVDGAWRGARDRLPAVDEVRFRRRFRLLRLVDQMDVYLTLLRGPRWTRRFVDERGEWPTPDARSGWLLLTSHWGAGTWLWPLLRARGVPAHFLVRRAEARDLGVSRVAAWYGAFRAWALARIGSLGPLFTGSSAGRVRAALSAGESVVGMLDLPVREGQRRGTARDGAFAMTVPIGLASLAIEAGAPIAIVTLGLDFETGRRDLRIESLGRVESLQALLDRYAAHFAARLAQSPDAWQLWREAALVLGDAPPQT